MKTSQTKNRPLLVQMIQPLVPHYRVPFFRQVAGSRELSLHLYVSPTMPGMPPSLPVPGLDVDSGHPCHFFLGGRINWQARLTLHPALSRGDVLVVDGNPRFLSNLPLWLRAKSRGAAVLWWGHGWSATSHPFRARLRLLLMRFADAIIVYTDAERLDLLSRGFHTDRVFALNNAIDDQNVTKHAAGWTTDRKREFRRSMQVDGCKLLLFCGRLRTSPPTDLDVALRALAQLVATDPTYRLIVIGDGPQTDALSSLARNLGLEAHVRWLGALYREEDLAPWFTSADCFLYPGPIGLSIIHAMSYDLPVITHDNPKEHCPEFAAFKDGVNGRSFPRGDAESLVRAVSDLFRIESRRESMAASAGRTVREGYSMRNMVARFIEAVRAASDRALAGR